MEASIDYIKMCVEEQIWLVQEIFVTDPQSGFMEFFHIIALTKLANWGKSTEFPVYHHLLYLVCTKVILKWKIYETVGFSNTVY